MIQRHGLADISPSSKIGLLCYLTDYMVVGVLEPGLVDIFYNGDKVEPRLNQIKFNENLHMK